MDSFQLLEVDNISSRLPSSKITVLGYSTIENSLRESCLPTYCPFDIMLQGKLIRIQDDSSRSISSSLSVVALVKASAKVTATSGGVIAEESSTEATTKPAAPRIRYPRRCSVTAHTLREAAILCAMEASVSCSDDDDLEVDHVDETVYDKNANRQGHRSSHDRQTKRTKLTVKSRSLMECISFARSDGHIDNMDKVNRSQPKKSATSTNEPSVRVPTRSMLGYHEKNTESSTSNDIQLMRKRKKM